MRILMFTTIFPPAIGGPATQCFNLCRALRGHGVQPVVVTYGDGFGRQDSAGYPVYTFQRFYGLGPFDRVWRWVIFPFYIARILRREKIDIIHCHSANMLSFMAAAVAKIFGVPRVLKFAGDWVWETMSTSEVQAGDFKEIYIKNFYARFLTTIEKVGLKLFNVIWTPSQFRRENVEYLLGKKAKTVIIPNALSFSDPNLPQKSPGQKITIVSANRFIPHKRIPWLVEAYAAVATPDTRLVLIGGGDKVQVELVKQIITRLGLSNSVELTGVLSSTEVYQIFREASFYVSASLEEGLPNVFIEAMHYGLPIVATDVGGCREMVTEGQTGFLVSPEDQTGLIKRMRLLVEDVELREKMARAAFVQSKNFDLSQRIRDFINLYQGLLRQ